MTRIARCLTASLVTVLVGALFTAGAAVADGNPNTAEAVLVGAGLTVAAAGIVFCFALLFTEC